MIACFISIKLVKRRQKRIESQFLPRVLLREGASVFILIFLLL